jgi:glyoxylase-like metal-dependent hydrolase (beta-lactamase superfamily II)
MATTLQRISKNIVYLPADDTTDRPILAAISGTRKSLLIDAGNSPAHVTLFLSELARCGIDRGDYVVITHWHWDHTFGISALSLPTIAHIETRQHLMKMMAYGWTDEAIDKRVREGVEIPLCADMIKKEYPNREEIVIGLPDIVFEKRLLLDLGGLHCRVEHIGGNHAKDASIIYVEEERTLFLGDCLGPAIYAENKYYQIESVYAVLEKVASYNAETYIESHWKPETREEFQREAERLRVTAGCMENYDGDRGRLMAELARKLGRPINQEDLETVTYFINGLG